MVLGGNKNSVSTSVPPENVAPFFFHFREKNPVSVSVQQNSVFCFFREKVRNFPFHFHPWPAGCHEKTNALISYWSVNDLEDKTEIFCIHPILTKKACFFTRAGSHNRSRRRINVDVVTQAVLDITTPINNSMLFILF